MKDIRAQWEKKVSEKLVGRTIKRVQYISEKDKLEMGWSCAGVVLILDDRHELMPMSDDEGNNAGALATTYSSLPTIPII